MIDKVVVVAVVAIVIVVVVVIVIVAIINFSYSFINQLSFFYMFLKKFPQILVNKSGTFSSTKLFINFPKTNYQRGKRYHS